jgi:nucleotide-binding universal stress UspA family protein
MKGVAMRPIVLATDGSPYAAEATFEAFRLARELAVPLLAISVANVSIPPYALAANPEAIATLVQAEHDRVAATLAEVGAAAADAGITCETEQATGPVAAAIRSLARARAACVIVVGAHGWGPARRAVHGSVAQELAESAPCPVLVARHGQMPTTEGEIMRPILLATDGSPSAEEATREAITLARAFGTTLVVASVAHLVLPAYGNYYGYGEIAADLHTVETAHVAEVLAATKSRIEATGVACETLALDGHPSEEICAAAARTQARLVVIGAHGWGRLGRMIHGSVSTAVLHDAPCPVLVVHGRDTSVEPAHEREAALAH